VGARRAATRPFPSGLLGLSGIVGAVGGIIVLVLTRSRLLTVMGSVLVLAGCLAFVTAVIASVVRHQLRRQAQFVSQTVERGMLDALPPGQVMEHLLTRVYGPSPSNRDIATAILGGEGLAPEGSDLTISEQTEIGYRLTRLDELTYQLVLDAQYSFRNRVPTASFVIFATSDTALRDSIVAGCRLPLFELWFVREDEAKPQFEESVEGMRESVLVGMEYVDLDDRVREVRARGPERNLREIKLQDWGKYLTFFRTDLAGERAIDRRMYMDKLRIFEIDLHALASPGTSVATIQRLTVRSTTLQKLSDGFCYWEAPYPCFVEHMRFDTVGFGADSGVPMWFHLKPFATRSPASPPVWAGDETALLPLRTWMLPGHGMALMWRPL
jgi:hypothetical protein